MSTRTRGARAQELDAMLLRLAAQGVRPRCGEPAAHDLFLSDVAEERALAATWCAGCPVLDECAAAGVEAKATFGVWGGVDLTVHHRADVGRAVPRRSGPSPVASSGSDAPATPRDTGPDTRTARSRAQDPHPASGTAAASSRPSRTHLQLKETQ